MPNTFTVPTTGFATSQVTSVDVVRNAQSTMQSIIVFITDSAKREDLLRHTVKNFDQYVKHKLVKLCQTRIIERYVAVERFVEQLLWASCPHGKTEQ